jgi:diacylglycerol kinase
LRKKDFTRSRLQAIKIALGGIKHVLSTQPNTWIHTAFTGAVFGAAALLKLPRGDWAILFLSVGLVWTAEIFNTAVEALVDLISPEFDPRAKVIKDVSAGAVLVSVLAAILVGLVVFGPYLWTWVSSFF